MVAAPDILAAETRVSPAADTQAPRPAIRVRTIHPRRGADLSMTVEQPADVAAYYTVPLFAEVSGKVTFLEKDIGHSVIKGEKIAVIESHAGGKSVSETLTAPFDGVIAGRGIDPGGFVPNAGLVPGATPLVTLQRNDIVTISARMPDRVAPLIGKDTETEICQDGLPSGGPLRAHITRLAPSLTATDRTIRVEVDLYNRSAAEFRDFMVRSEQEQHADLKGREPPQLPTGLPEGQAARLIPGSYGRMRLILRRFADVPLLPGAAIVRAGGVPYVYRVDQGVARRTRVVIDLEDGTLARVVMVTHVNGGQQRRELTDTDEIIVSNQGELEDGQPVTADPADL